MTEGYGSRWDAKQERKESSEKGFSMRARTVAVKPDKSWEDPPVVYEEGDVCGIVSPAIARRIRDYFLRKPGEKQSLDDAVKLLIQLHKELPRKSCQRQTVEQVLVLLGKAPWEL